MKEYRCPNCGRLLFRAKGQAVVQLKCDRCDAIKLVRLDENEKVAQTKR